MQLQKMKVKEQRLELELKKLALRQSYSKPQHETKEILLENPVNTLGKIVEIPKPSLKQDVIDNLDNLTSLIDKLVSSISNFKSEICQNLNEIEKSKKKKKPKVIYIKSSDSDDDEIIKPRSKKLEKSTTLDLQDPEIENLIMIADLEACERKNDYEIYSDEQSIEETILEEIVQPNQEQIDQQNLES